MASYPGALHAFIVADPDKVGVPLADEHIDAHAELAAELAAVQAVLGTSPAGSHGTVRAAIEAAGEAVTVTDNGNGTTTMMIGA